MYRDDFKGTLQEEIDRLRTRIRELEGRQSRCSHEWGDVAYAPVITEAYSTHSWHGPGPLESHPLIHVPRQEKPRWCRTCKTCGLVQYTDQTKEVQRRGTVPGTTATEKVPTFRD